MTRNRFNHSEQFSDEDPANDHEPSLLVTRVDLVNVLLVLTLFTLSGCAVQTTGVVQRTEGMMTITRQGDSFLVQPLQLTALATQEADTHCVKAGKKLKVLHSKEIPAGPLGRWPESEILFRCD